MDMKDKISSKVATELLFIINQFPYSQKNTIPKEFIEVLEQKHDDSYLTTFNKNIPFTKQNFSDETMQILKLVYEKYLNN